jgi:hypothetical protein
MTAGTNIFEDLITDEFKGIHKKMIDAMLADDKFTVPCTLNYSATKFDDCENCLYDPIGGKSSNRYQSGGPIPFYHGVCPVCNGVGKIQVTSTETIYLMPIWDSKDWYPLSQTNVNMADIEVQTMSKITSYESLVRATSIIIDTTVQHLGIPEFTRLGRPEICGLGQSTHLITAWKRA